MFENCVRLVIDILLWKSTLLNATAFFIIHILLWSLHVGAFNLYTTLCVLLVVCVLVEAFSYYFNTNDNYVPGDSELLQHLDFVDQHLDNLFPDDYDVLVSYAAVQLFACMTHKIIMYRTNHMNMFHMVVCTLGVSLYAISVSVSGVSGTLCTYIGCVSMYVISLYIKLYPTHFYKTCRSIVSGAAGAGGADNDHQPADNTFDLNEDDLLPIIHPLNVNDLDGESVDADSCTNSFVSGLSTMPSHLDVDVDVDVDVDDSHVLFEDDFDMNTTNSTMTSAMHNNDGTSSPSSSLVTRTTLDDLANTTITSAADAADDADAGYRYSSSSDDLDVDADADDDHKYDQVQTINVNTRGALLTSSSSSEDDGHFCEGIAFTTTSNSTPLINNVVNSVSTRILSTIGSSLLSTLTTTTNGSNANQQQQALSANTMSRSRSTSSLASTSSSGSIGDFEMIDTIDLDVNVVDAATGAGTGTGAGTDDIHGDNDTTK